MNKSKKYLSRFEIRGIIKQCLALGLSVSETKQTVRYRENRARDVFQN